MVQTKAKTITLVGASGSSYEFELFDWGTSFNKVGGVYAVLHRTLQNKYQVLYIGQTSDLSERFDDHHKQLCFDRNGKTHIGVHRESSEKKRFAKETDLVRKYNPPCND